MTSFQADDWPVIRPDLLAELQVPACPQMHYGAAQNYSEKKVPVQEIHQPEIRCICRQKRGLV